MFFFETNFTKLNAVASTLEKGEYELCVFTSCEFGSADLSDQVFIECEFVNCNLSLARLHKTSFRDCVFRDCKLLGLRFDQCNPIALSPRFERCALGHASFHKCVLKKIRYEGCTLTDVDFTQADLTEALFDDCDLAGASFDATNLEKADFRTAMNVVMDPERNRLSKAKFSLQGLPGLVGKYGIVVSG